MDKKQLFRMPKKGMLLVNWPELELQLAPFSGSLKGSYLVLVMHYLTGIGPLPDDPVALANLSRMPLDEWLRSGSSLLKLFSLGPDGLWHDDRLDREIAKAKTRSLNGRRGMQVRWGASSTTRKRTARSEGASSTTRKCTNKSAQSGSANEQR